MASFDKELLLKIRQGGAGTRLRELEGENRILLGEMNSGKTTLLLHYILDYWQRTRNRIMVVLRSDRIQGWNRLANKIFGNKITRGTSIQDNYPITVTPLYFEGDRKDEVAQQSLEKIYRDVEIPSNIRLVIVEEETFIGNAHSNIETIFSRRPGNLLKEERMKNAKKVWLNSYLSLPKPVYHYPFLYRARRILLVNKNSWTK